MKKLGFGLMRLPTLDPNDPSKIDIELLKKMVDVFMERGFTYFDTAWLYCGFQSEPAIKAALVDRYPRESFQLATKLHAGFMKCKEDRDKIFNASWKRPGQGISTTICCTMSGWNGIPFWNSTTASHGCRRKRHRDW